MPNAKNNTWAIVVAAGSGRRLQEATHGVCKQFLMFRGSPLYWRSVRTLAICPFIKGIALVLPPDSLEYEQARVADLYALDDPGLPISLVAGGKERQDSVRNGISAVPRVIPAIFVHDAARPFAGTGLLWRLYNALESGWSGVVPGLPVTDTIKLATGERIDGTLPRSRLVAVQTPQLFWAESLREAHKRALEEGWRATDDASLLEKCEERVRIVRGDTGNIKITNPEDLAMLAPAGQELIPCNGFGYDVHRFGPGRPLRIGGVPIPCGLELEAHSDGDVLLHALIDAIFGCAALGDLGKHFPDTDPDLDGISSAVLLDRALELANQAGVKIWHVDLTLVAQKPRLNPYAGEIAANIARMLQIPVHSVNFKATTEEHLGFTGHGEGIKAYAMASATREITMRD